MLSANLCPIEEAFGVADAGGEVMDPAREFAPTRSPSTSASRRSKSGRRRRHAPQRRESQGSRESFEDGVRSCSDQTTETRTDPEHHAPASAAPAPEQVTAEESDLQRVWRNSGIDNTADDGGWAQAVAAHAASRQTSRYQAQFAKAPDASRIPEGVEVTLGANAAPFLNTDDHEQTTTLPAVNTRRTGAEQVAAPRSGHATTKEAEVAHVPPKHAADTVDVHDELEWMRNNLSHLGDQIQQLTAVVEKTHESHASTSAGAAHMVPNSVSWSHRICDNILYLLSGLFVLFALDMVYRAGSRASRK